MDNEDNHKNEQWLSVSLEGMIKMPEQELMLSDHIPVIQGMTHLDPLQFYRSGGPSFNLPKCSKCGNSTTRTYDGLCATCYDAEEDK